jgi:hypothetical protein
VRESRWTLERSDTPRYGGVRLFRQPPPWKWFSVFEEVVAELRRPHERSGESSTQGGMLESLR